MLVRVPSTLKYSCDIDTIKLYHSYFLHFHEELASQAVVDGAMMKQFLQGALQS